jgi:magnesium-transporting ATPase (P-type)
MVFLQSSEDKGFCYIETKNLDGETNLKTKYVQKGINQHMKSLPNLDHLTGKIGCEEKNDQIYKFEGTFNNPSLKAALSSENLLLRGSSLRNTDWVIGCVVYAGHDTKIIMNSNNSKYKLSSIEKKTNK